MTLLHRAPAVLAALAACVLSQPSHADTLYTRRAAFLDAAGPVTTIDFNGTSGGSQLDLYHGPSWALSGVGFSTQYTIYSVGYYDGFSAGYAYGNDYLEWQDSAAPLTITLPMPVRAVAFDFMEVRGQQDLFSITIGDVHQNVVTGAAPSFFGLIADTPFTTLTIADQGGAAFDFATIDNLSFGLASARPVPEPAPLALLGAALASLVPLQRRLRAADQRDPPLHR